jgi:hypothetical protein
MIIKLIVLKKILRNDDYKKDLKEFKGIVSMLNGPIIMNKNVPRRKFFFTGNLRYIPYIVTN